MNGAVDKPNGKQTNSYNLQSDQLYSVLWYKDNDEFYKYVNSDQSQHIYEVEGINVYPHKPDSQKVILQQVTLDATGVYKCEVSAEAPQFATAHGQAYMEVIAPPTEGPTITGVENIYATGDILALNCTSGKSYPAAQITWFINDIKVKADSEMIIRHRDLLSTVSSLRLEVGPHHLTVGRINVRCVSIVRTSERATERFEDLRETNILVQGRTSFIGPCLPLLIAMMILHQTLVMN
ncbi:uncharacterized protein [Chelonus insularis]|uniref:uncharacterized protein n=1 Tax=Chelonus insularis TaxID=460826 RepID=UPI00158E5051|nr:uncharacterized protein LOC118070868 [Chelonus insularis]